MKNKDLGENGERGKEKIDQKRGENTLKSVLRCGSGSF